MLNNIGMKRGFLQKGNTVDLDSSIKCVLNEYANGVLGKFSLDEEGISWLD